MPESSAEIAAGPAVNQPTPEGLRLGEILVSMGAVAPDVLANFLSTHADAVGRIGLSLLARKLVSLEQIQSALRRQVDQLFARLLTLQDADTVYCPGEPVQDADGIAVDLDELLCP